MPIDISRKDPWTFNWTIRNWNRPSCEYLAHMLFLLIEPLGIEIEEIGMVIHSESLLIEPLGIEITTGIMK